MSKMLERGQMLTGQFGRRYMVKDMIAEMERGQVFEITESGKQYIAVTINRGGTRFRATFLEAAAEHMNSPKEYVWPIDVFNFDFENRKNYGYVIEKFPEGFCQYTAESKVSFEDKLRICYGVAKSFAKLRIAGYAYAEVPAIFYNEHFEVKLVAVPIPAGSKLVKEDVLGSMGVLAPEQFAVSAVKLADFATNQFLLASLMFDIIIGRSPFTYDGLPDINQSYTKFIFDGDPQNFVNTYGYAIVENWVKIGEPMRQLFKKTFTLGTINAINRVEPDVWAEEIKKVLDVR